jgi:fatty-acyl-CoA synthase
MNVFRTEFCFADNLEALAAAVPERTFLTFRERRFSYADYRDRSRRLAHYLLSVGLGNVRPRSELEDHASGQDHVGLYLYNGNEYLEGMMGAFMARCAPFNVNYRYVEGELEYLFNDARPRALIYHARFAPMLAQVLPRIAGPIALLQVEDESHEPLLPGAVGYEAALAHMPSERPDVTPSPDDLYIVYTGGTTGMPKGVLWRQHDVFMGAMGGTYGDGKQHESVEAMVEGAKRVGDKLHVCPVPPFMHGAAHWMAFVTMTNGGSIHVQDTPERLVPAEVFRLAERVQASNLLIVGDAFAIPLLEELDRKSYDLSHLRMISSGGAILSSHVKARLKQHLPGLFIRDTLGSSESGAQAIVAEGRSEFQLLPDSGVAKHDLTRLLEPGEDEVGFLVRTGHIPLGYLGDPDKTQRTFVRIQGKRYAVPGDHAELTAEGMVRLLGRGSVCINSGGEKIYPEEVEEVLKSHPAIFDVVVVGVPHQKWGAQVVAVVEPREGMQPTLESLHAHAEHRLSRYKLPRKLVLVPHMVRSPAGKADYRWAKQVATEAP